MKKVKVLCSLVIISFFFSSLIIAQHGTPNMRRVGVVDANQIKTVFMNNGVIAQPGSEGPRLAWQYLHNGYAGDMSILLGLELPIRDYRRGTIPQDGIPDTIPSVIITPVDRPGGGEGDNGISYTFEPLPGYFNPLLNEIGRGVAVSTDLESWPESWPDHPEYGTGVWNGLSGPDNFVGDEEALFVMDDFNDEENFLQNDFLPDSTDPSVKGHGIEIKVRYVELNNLQYKDILFKIYDIKNKSLHNYHKLVFGNLTGTYVGGENPEWNDDVTLYYPKDNLIVSSDFDNFINPLANPGWEGRVGMFGESFIYAPTTNKIASFQNFVPSGDISMSDDYDLWERMRPGFYQWPLSVFYQDSIPYALRGEDGDYLWGSEYFSINSGETKRVVTASACGYSKDEILIKMKYAEALYNSNFDTIAVKNSITLTCLNYHKIVSGNEPLTWSSINSDGTVDILYSPDYGKSWETIAKNIPNNSEFIWNTSLVEDGSFAKLLICAKNDNGYIYAIDESEYFTVDNPGNGKPFVKILNDNIEPGITGDNFNFNLLIGDPENQSLLLKTSYSTNSDSVFYLTQSLLVLSDTLSQIVPINLSIIPNSTRLKIKFEVSDGTNFGYDVTPVFMKESSRQYVGASNLEWIKHYSQSLVEIRIVDPAGLTGDEYIISFADTIPNHLKTFSVFNKSTNQYVLSNKEINSGSESILFDGLVLYTEDFITDLDVIRSGWNYSSAQNLNFSINQLMIPPLVSYRYPFDYKFVFSDVYNDSSNLLTAVLGNVAPPVNPNLNFKIYRSTNSDWERIQFAFAEPSSFRKNILSFQDVAIFSDPTGNDFSWRISFIGDSTSNIPVAGDTLYIYTKKGLSVFDTLRIHDLVSNINETPKSEINYTLLQNYPNPFNPSTIINYSIAAYGRVSIKVYDILGREVVTLVNEEKKAGNYEVSFNASQLASGVYFYQIKTGDFIQSKKMLLLK